MGQHDALLDSHARRAAESIGSTDGLNVSATERPSAIPKRRLPPLETILIGGILAASIANAILLLTW